ncbi:acyltransferase family protein [Lactiplantibacillus plantarum]|uniref:Acyltransferase n=1 Tax=Lactiplantibacillus plantarum (strain ATCC BAA-793 / NCIMB 8826 / WCFS1) TaxID=220668 RepID=F9UM68_LACPL|nr:acyltransferase family protein [Lactiplantibacillus plantarum]MDE4414643.1 acetyltransferase [Lactiplantibacillus plantarum]MDE4418721.1 acetyltransferase [Lactiplantibacillus plantarum]MDE4420984.1 acetyltransferase [Lactiplantibacillus plantarum]MDE4422838.1 acetyltransferase [Lactiplantibacillus plantarum]MDE4427738.1 acetyltransferase [Lactiplantibacillus plantarum]
MNENLRSVNMSRTMSRMNRHRMNPRRYITGFDGIRTLAVLGVIIYHLMPASLQGGYLGVPIFFVVSGYLITDILLQDILSRGHVRIWRFLGHRMRRLYPAFVTMLLGTTAYITLFQRSLLTNIRATVLTNLVYVYNWFEINHGQSYFDRFNGESPFTHLWSLSIEGQYYLFWPLVIGILMVIFKKRSRVFWFMMIAAGISAITMAMLYDPANTNRVYYGTDTRMFAILLGSGLAFIWPSRELSADIANVNRVTLDILGGASLIAIIWIFFQMSGQSDFTYRGGMLLFTVLSTVLVATVAHPASHLNRVLTNPLFKYVGQRSYGIYLYQFPVMIFYETKVKNIGDHLLLNSLIEVALILIVTELSYRFIENPMRHYDYSRLLVDFKDFLRKPKFNRVTTAIVALTTVLFVITAVGFVQQPSKAEANKKTELQKTIAANSKAADKKNAAALKRQKAAQAAAASSKKVATEKMQTKQAEAKLNSKQKQVEKEYDLKPQVVLAMANTDLTAIGDSVLLDVSSDLQDVIPGTVVQGRVGRQVTEVPGIINSLKSQGQLAHNVLLNIGTNGTITDDQAEQVVKLIGKDRQIFWVTAHVPTQSWQNQVNAQIAKTAKKHANVHVIDWHGRAQNQSGWFADDNVHPNTTGNRQLTNLIANRIAEVNNN